MELQEAVKLRPSYADAFTGMGVSLKELGHKDEAAACLQQVVRLRPNCALSLGNLAGASPPQACDLFHQQFAAHAWTLLCC